MVCCVIVLYGMVWLSSTLCGVVYFYMVRCGIVLHGVVWYRPLWCGTVLYSVVCTSQV